MIKNILLLVMTGIGIAILFWGGSILKQCRAALSWPQTQGHMISSGLTINHLPKFIDPRADPARWYGTHLQYEYKVGDQPYISDRLSFREADSPNPQDALKVMNKYRREREVTVFYDPKNPQEAVLQPGYIGGDLYIILMIGGLLALGGICIFYSQSLELSHSEESGYIQQGDIYQSQGKFEEALLAYDYAVRLNPSSVVCYSRRGGLYLQKENWDKAIADFNQVIAMVPNNALAHFCLGNAYLGKKAYDKAWVNMQKAMENGFHVEPEILESIKKNLG